jgi:hypothetical protein
MGNMVVFMGNMNCTNYNELHELRIFHIVKYIHIVLLDVMNDSINIILP